MKTFPPSYYAENWRRFHELVDSHPHIAYFIDPDWNRGYVMHREYSFYDLNFGNDGYIRAHVADTVIILGFERIDAPGFDSDNIIRGWPPTQLWTPPNNRRIDYSLITKDIVGR